MIFLTEEVAETLTTAQCGGVEVLKVIKFVWELLDIVFIFIPIGLILFISLDFAKNVMAGKEDDMRKNVSLVIKRIIFCIALFLVPTIVQIAMYLLADSGVDVIANFNECIKMAENEDLVDQEVIDEEVVD